MVVYCSGSIKWEFIEVHFVHCLALGAVKDLQLGIP